MHQLKLWIVGRKNKQDSVFYRLKPEVTPASFESGMSWRHGEKES